MTGLVPRHTRGLGRQGDSGNVQEGGSEIATPNTAGERWNGEERGGLGGLN